MRFTASLGSVTDTLNSNCDYAYVNEFPVPVEDLGVDKLRNIAQKAVGLMRGHKFGWRTFWDSNPDWSCLRLNSRHSGESAMLGKSAGLLPLHVTLWHLPYNSGEKKRGKKTRLSLVKNCKLGTIQHVDIATF